MGEKENQPFQLSFNHRLKVDFRGSRIRRRRPGQVTSDGGLMLVRELEERLGFSQLIQRYLTDFRRGRNTQLALADLLRQSVYSRVAGYQDINDAKRLWQDPAFRLIGSEKIWERGAALPSRLHSFETELLTPDANLAGLAAINRELIARAEAMDSPRRVVLEMDSIEVPVFGQQECSAYSSQIHGACYHPLLLFNGHGDCLAAKLRPGNADAAEGWEEFLLPEIERQRKLGRQVMFRAEAPFARRELCQALEGRDVKYAIRLAANDYLKRHVEDLLSRPAGRGTRRTRVLYKSFLHREAGWKKARRVVAQVEFHAGELFPRLDFMVTNLEGDSREVVRFYHRRGKAEQRIQEGKEAVTMTRLSCHRFRWNQARLGLSVIAYNLGNLWGRLVLPKRFDHGSLASRQQRLVKTGGRLIKRGRYYWLLLAEGPLTRRLFGAMLRRIAALPRAASGPRCYNSETGHSKSDPARTAG